VAIYDVVSNGATDVDAWRATESILIRAKRISRNWSHRCHSNKAGYVCISFCYVVRQFIRQVGVNQCQDPCMLFRPQHWKAGTEPPPFHGHVRSEVDCADVTLLYFFITLWNVLKAIKHDVETLLWRCRGNWFCDWFASSF